MQLRKFEIDSDFEEMKEWVTDERKLTPNAFTYKDESWGRCNMIYDKERTECRV